MLSGSCLANVAHLFVRDLVEAMNTGSIIRGFGSFVG